MSYVGHFWNTIFCPISFQYLLYTPKSLIFTPKYLLFTTIYLFFVFHCARSIHGQVPIGCPQSVSNDGAHVMRGQGGRVGESWWRNFCASVREK